MLTDFVVKLCLQLNNNIDTTVPHSYYLYPARILINVDFPAPTVLNKLRSVSIRKYHNLHIIIHMAQWHSQCKKYSSRVFFYGLFSIMSSTCTWYQIVQFRKKQLFRITMYCFRFWGILVSKFKYLTLIYKYYFDSIYSFLEMLNSKVEFWFLEPPREAEIGSRNRQFEISGVNY